MVSLSQDVIGAVVRPRTFFEGLARAPRVSTGLGMVVLAAMSLAGLDLILYSGGNRPSIATGALDPLNGIALEGYYFAQALFAPPLFVLGWLFYGAFALLLLRIAGSRARLRPLLGGLGLAVGIPLLFLFVIPDLLAFGVGGFAAISAAMPYYVPLCLLWILVLGSLAVIHIGKVGWATGAMVNILAFALHAIPLALFLR